MSRAPLSLVSLAVAAALLAGCSGTPDGEASTAPSATDTATATGTATTDASPSPTEPEESPEGKQIVITVTEDGIEPRGERVDVGVNERVTLVIDSTRKGELHAHSTPGQEIAFGRGTTRAPLVIDKPGLVDVEDHDTGIVVVQLNVR